MTETSTPLGRRDRRKLEARQRLLSAARTLIADVGIAGVRINEVTTRADLGFGTFYSHFESKDELVEAVIAEALTELGSTIGDDAVHTDDAAVAASNSFRRFMQFAVDEPELARVVVEHGQAEGTFEDSVRPWALATLERGRETARFDIDNIDLCLTVVAASAIAAMRAVLNGRIAADAETASEGAAMMLGGLGIDRQEARRIAKQPLP